jgi:hypothetical protein
VSSAAFTSLFVVSLMAVFLVDFQIFLSFAPKPAFLAAP